MVWWFIDTSVTTLPLVCVVEVDHLINAILDESENEQKLTNL